MKYDITLWEEKNLIEPPMNCESKKVLETNDIMQNIETDVEKNLSNDILTKRCPMCNGIQTYKNDRQLSKAIRNKTKCKSCNAKNIKCHLYSGLWKIHLDDMNKLWNKNCTRCNCIQIYKTKINLMKAIKKNQVCRKCQLAIRKSTSLNNPNYNPNACLYFDKLNIDMGWTLQHALNGGEIKYDKYWLDAYDMDKNIVVEYDEKHHYRYGKLSQRDLDRMVVIMSKLKCKFYRYNESKNQLFEYSNIGEQVAII